MKNFFVNLFGKKQELSKIQKRPEPMVRDARESEASEYFKKGDVIGGNYDVLNVLGKGGFGVVYLVRSRQTSEIFALKTFREELLADLAAREAFKKEALLWVNLERHPFILAAMWVDEAFGRLLVTMDYVAPDAQGHVSLADHLAGTSGPLEPNRPVKWAIQFCLGMEHAQTHGVQCHRDIKPTNILITQDGTLKISDFGLAAAAEIAGSETTSRIGSLVTGSAESGFGVSLIRVEGKARCCGTPGYIAPEVYRGDGADIRSDIYSFGLVLWQMTSGSRVPPFMVQWRGDMERFLREIYEQQMFGSIPLVAGKLGTIIERCLKPNPSERYGSFHELRVDLEPIWKERTGRKFEIPQIGEKPAGFWSSKGMSLSNLGRYEEAIGCFDKALAIDSGYPAAWGGKGVALDGLGRFNEAISCYDRALAIDPRNVIVWLNKAFPLGKLGRHEEAIACYDKALAIDSSKANAWSGKGICLKSLGQYSEAIVCYDKALAIDPRNAYAWNNKSNALKALKRTEEAIECLDKALAIDPHYPDAWYNKANAMLALGKPKEAIGCYDKTLVINPRHELAWQNKGNVLYNLSRYEEAVGCYDKALAIDPRDLYTWNNKGGALAAIGRLEDAMDCHNKALAIDPRNMDAWQSKGNALAAVGRHKEAMGCYDKALTIDPQNTENWYRKGKMLNALGQLQEAVECYDKALKIDPRNTSAWYHIAQTEDALGHSLKAAALYAIFIKVSPPQYVQEIALAQKRIQELHRV